MITNAWIFPYPREIWLYSKMNKWNDKYMCNKKLVVSQCLIWLNWIATLKLGMALWYNWTTSNFFLHLVNPVHLNIILFLYIRKDLYFFFSLLSILTRPDVLWWVSTIISLTQFFSICPPSADTLWYESLLALFTLSLSFFSFVFFSSQSSP